MPSEYKGKFQHRFWSKCYIYLPKFTSKEKSAGYSIYSCSRIASIERVLNHFSMKKKKSCPGIERKYEDY